MKIEEAIWKLKNSKAERWDEITGEMIKNHRVKGLYKLPAVSISKFIVEKT